MKGVKMMVACMYDWYRGRSIDGFLMLASAEEESEVSYVALLTLKRSEPITDKCQSLNDSWLVASKQSLPR